MKNVLEKKDYDFYTIQLPPSMLVGLRRKRYLIGELGKQHPRFSDEFCFDSKLRLDKKGFSCDVVVMDKFRLSELKNEKKYQRVFVEEKKTSYFNTGFQKLVGSPLVALCLCVALTGVAVGALIFANLKNETAGRRGITGASEIEVQGENAGHGKFDGHGKTASAASDYELKDFFEVVSKENGKISWLEWKVTNSAGHLSLAVSNVFPEVLMQKSNLTLGQKLGQTSPEISFSAVTYSDGIPSMVVSVKNNVASSAGGGSSANVASSAGGGSRTAVNQQESFRNLFPELRDILKKHQAVIFQENQNPWMVSFYCNYDKELFFELCRLCEDKAVNVCGISVHQKDGDLLQVQITFQAVQAVQMEKNQTEKFQSEKSPDKEKILQLVGEYLNLFQKTGTKTVSKVQSAKAESKMQSPGVKTGEIAYSDGSVLVFYKTAEGKIVKRREYRK